MKSVTEFANFTLAQGLKAKAALSAEGKTPEDMQTSLGETFKYEGDKLKHFMSALDVAEKNTEGLKRVLVMSIAEGEKAPPKAIQVEEVCYVPEFHVVAKPAQTSVGGKGKDGKGGGRGGPGKGGGKGRGGGGEKESPWGLSPEQKAAKKAQNTANAAAARAKK